LLAIEISLSGKTALVTGASRKAGIGAAIARLLAEAGANVFVTYFTPYDQEMPWGSQPEEARILLNSLQSCGVQAAASEADLADPAVPADLFDQAEAALGPVDILVNNATHDVEGNLYSLTARTLDQHYAVNVRGPALLCAEFARRHDGRPGGRIINMVSGEMLHPMVENLPYAVTKGAVEALTITLSGTLASKGITVNAVDPGATDTGWMTPEIKTWHEQNAPMGRIGLPKDAAHLVLFLASELSGWVTGQIIHSRGGFF
jgi:3-oxoacyl-[acyl-carrier protein] reductase